MKMFQERVRASHTSLYSMHFILIIIVVKIRVLGRFLNVLLRDCYQNSGLSRSMDFSTREISLPVTSSLPTARSRTNA